MSDENSNSVLPVAYYCGIFVLFFLIFVYYKAFQKNCPNCVANLLPMCRKKASDNSLGPVFSDPITGLKYPYESFVGQDPLFKADKDPRSGYEATKKIQPGGFDIKRTRSLSL